MKTGDKIWMILINQQVIVGFADETVVLSAGWPEISMDPRDCMLLSACTDEEHMALVCEIAASADGPLRVARCREYLLALPLPLGVTPPLPFVVVGHDYQVDEEDD